MNIEGVTSWKATNDESGMLCSHLKAGMLATSSFLGHEAFENAIKG
jgi:hypothetical protein